eukprot:c15249_g1_i1.p1 GENE.c15249_g1_i1~~c15249_g1_i1.p1  ORF type:complete len:295 (+),score=115.54 c15249_g1_i1:54-887(+)
MSLPEIFREPLPDVETVVLTFSFGANMCTSSLQGRGVVVEKSARAILKNYELIFNVHSAPFEGQCSYGNVRKQEGSEVHGVLHWVKAKYMLALDQFEDPLYSRITQKIVTYEGEEVSGYIYIANLPDNSPAFPPGERYLKVLIHGAKQENLSEEWIQKLKGLEFVPYKKLTWTEQQLKDLKAKAFKKDEISEHFVINGVVFDQSTETSPLLKRLLRGDMTLTALAMVSYEPKVTSFADASKEQITAIESVIANTLNKKAILGHIEGACLYLSSEPTA